MTSGVVDLLQVIQIDHQERERHSRAARAGELLLEALVEAGAAGDVSQRVGAGQRAQLVLPPADDQPQPSEEQGGAAAQVGERVPIEGQLRGDPSR